MLTCFIIILLISNILKKQKSKTLPCLVFDSVYFLCFCFVAITKTISSCNIFMTNSVECFMRTFYFHLLFCSLSLAHAGKSFRTLSIYKTDTNIYAFLHFGSGIFILLCFGISHFTYIFARLSYTLYALVDFMRYFSHTEYRGYSSRVKFLVTCKLIRKYEWARLNW